MCFVIDKDFPNPVKASDSLPVYKTLRLVWHEMTKELCLKSSIKDYVYAKASQEGVFLTKNKTISLQPRKETRYTFKIYEGYYSFIGFTYFKNNYFDNISKLALKIKENEVEDLNIHAECIVPEGAVYYINPYCAEVISSNIRIDSIEDSNGCIYSIDCFMKELYKHLTEEE